MRYEEPLFRPPSEAYSYILQATIGCSHNLCIYCDMYRSKKFRVRPWKEIKKDLHLAQQHYGNQIEKIFVADGDALVLSMELWTQVLQEIRLLFPQIRQVSCYATAINLLEKTTEELRTLQELGLNLLYIGPESGDDITLKRLVKGANHAQHVEAAQKATDAGMKLSTIFLLGAGGTERTQEHASESARLITGMNPDYLSALTLTVLPNTPLFRAQEKQKFTLPDKPTLLTELRTMIAESNPNRAVFRTNHASNYLPLRGTLPQDKTMLVSMIDQALQGEIALRPEWSRGL